MKRYLIPTIAVLVVMAVTLSLYAQPGGGMGGGERGGARGGAGARMGRGGFRGFIRDENLDTAIAAIDKVLASLKKVKEIAMPRPEGGFRDMSDEDRTKMMDAMQKRGELMQSIPETLEQQAMVLKGGFQLRQEHQDQIDELQAIADSATKEKATATAKMIQDLIAKRNKDYEANMEKLGIRGGMRGGRMGGGGMGGQRRGGGGQQ